MDPIIAVGLAAGILQFLKAGFEAVSVCQEIHRDGSLAEHRDTEEIIELLTTTAEQLKHPIHSLPAAASGHDKDVIELSKKCSETAAELLSELSRLRQGSGDGFRQVVDKTVRAIRKKKYLTKTQKKLESYRDILNIRILSQLDYRTALHDGRFDKLEERIKNLVIALNEGHNTYAKLISDQTATIVTHIDRRHDQMDQKETSRRLRDELLKSLFYPEISSRFDNIARSHDGTCRWFFESSKPEANTENVQYHYRFAKRPRVRPWDNFEEWLRSDGHSPYWLSGKPGSGKSTLMKYICTKFYDYCQSLESSSPWSSAHDVIMCSFFFWSLGSSIQKSYLGLLKTLLYQIARQRENSIPFISKQVETPGSDILHEWTEERLENALKLFLLSKPSRMRVCIFIDGLDEYEGDENNLMTIIRLLSRSPGIKVCASSRPEEIFRQGFASCPHMRLQDLNNSDILRATSDRLIPALSDRFSESESVPISGPTWHANWLTERLTEKSQGIFLWAELMTKDIIRGARNADTFSELEERLDRTPDTIDGLYMHMLERLDKSYVREAASYFHHIVESDAHTFDYENSPTLLHFACNEESAWAYVDQRSTAYFLTPEFEETCCNLEIRILSRCAGLVEIDESRLMEIYWLRSPNGKVMINQDEKCLSRYLREVKFIHKTARDFVRSNFKFFEDSNLQMTGLLATTRGRIAVAYLMPILMSKLKTIEESITLDPYHIGLLMTSFWPSARDSPTMHSASFQIIERTYDLLFYLNEKLNGSRYEMHELYEYEMFGNSHLLYPLPLAHVIDFASFFGRWDYIQHHMSKESISTQDDVERVVSSAILGFARVGFPLDQYNHFMNYVSGVVNILLDYLPRTTETEMHASTAIRNHQVGNHCKWTILLGSVSSLMSYYTNWWPHHENLGEILGPCKKVIKTFMQLDTRADINILLTHAFCIKVRNERETSIRMVVKETLLAFVKRRKHWDLDLISDIEAFLCDLDATDRRIFHGIEYEFVGNGSRISTHNVSGMGIPLTNIQSQRLSHAYPHERLRLISTGINRERLIEIGTEDTMSTESDAQAEDIVKYALSEIS